MRSLKMFLGEKQCTIYAGPETPYKTCRWNVKRHCNAQYELHIALNGNCTIDVDSENFFLTSEDALLIAPGQYHSPKEASSDYECFILSFMIKTPSIAKEFYENNSKSVKIRLSEIELLLLKELFKKNSTVDLFQNECTNSIYTLLILYLFKRLHFFADLQELNSPDSERRLDNIDDFFEESLADNATEEALARKLNISSRQLNRVLHTYYGMGFRQKLCNSRMNYAGWLLCATDMTVSEICRTVGYMSETSFFKAFRSYYNMTPLQYRKKSNNELDG